MSVISGYNCSQEEAAICEACDQAIDDSYVIKLLNETMGPQTVSTLRVNDYLFRNIFYLYGVKRVYIYIYMEKGKNDSVEYLVQFE